MHDVAPPLELLTPAAGAEPAWLERAFSADGEDLPDTLTPLACFSESDCGIATAERVAAALKCRHANDVAPKRRHKWLLHEALAEAGLPRCRQRLCETAAEALEFFEDEVARGGARVVVKPCRGVGSEDVALCASREDIEAAMAMLGATTRYAGGPNDFVVAQSFLDGPEFAVDSVSRDGEHKVTAVWKYRRPGCKSERAAAPPRLDKSVETSAPPRLRRR